ncbi:hypothetical protein [Pantoea ananatis]|uniref:hypothetical protein n=1 Tax=Pantoea ananas TaxID=553 RepID=UPI000CF3F53B|nr:hypothetical protein [Pantoea ananatis]PQK82903.1 hypothetical protein CG431_20045 [Pantoea ananatis]
MHQNDLDRRIESYQQKVRDAYDIGPTYYKVVLRRVLHEIVRHRDARIYTEEEAQQVWRSVLPSVGAEEYGGISESFEKSGSYRIAFDAADELAEMLSAYRRDR